MSSDQRKWKKYDSPEVKVDYSKLKSCPKCGCTEVGVYYETPRNGHIRVFVCCSECEFRVDGAIKNAKKELDRDLDWIRRDELELIKQWNKVKREENVVESRSGGSVTVEEV